MKSLRRRRGLSVVAMLLLTFFTTAISSPAQTYTVLSQFVEFNGISFSSFTSAPLVQGFDGNFYGLSPDLGDDNNGAVFQLTPTGTLTYIHSFIGSDGQQPLGGLTLATNGNLYGTTSKGGSNNAGIIFKSTTAGAVTTVHNFCSRTNCADGGNPQAGLVLAGNGIMWGTTSIGGGPSFDGTIFELTTGGTVNTLHSFSGPDGAAPAAALVETVNGTYLGSTQAGGGTQTSGNAGFGTLFEITGAGELTTIHSFQGTEGQFPTTPLVQGPNGLFYGVDIFGTNNIDGDIFSIAESGANFKLVHRYPVGRAQGDQPVQLLLGTDGNFYGITSLGGANGGGTIFQMTPSGTLTILHDFCGAPTCEADGEQPANLLQSTDGNFYGATYLGGTLGSGVAFELSMGLPPFVETVPTSGGIGNEVVILGTDLTGATNVTFNGTPATFTVVSPTEITATVPAGAKTGNVQVTTPGGNLLSNIAYVVR